MVDWSVSMLSQRQPMVATGEPKSIHTGSFVLLGDTVRCLLLSEPGHTVTLCRPLPQSHHSNVLATRVGFSIAAEDANKRTHIMQQYLVIEATQLQSATIRKELLRTVGLVLEYRVVLFHRAE